MAQMIRERQITIPHNTPLSAGFSVDLNLPDEIVETVDLKVPSGPLGLMGFALAYSDQQIVPYEAGTFFKWNDDRLTWAFDDYPSGGDWQLIGYNDDVVYDHTVYLTFHDIPLSSTPLVTPSITIVSNTLVGSGVTF
jgi:hypothetical protein